ncbi:DUF500-domain-containing protein [Pseudovirgaria hyperparasitica]|uniref:DUF500-domain-containing protein n=1 Tax=Pseudovirgaria hyperparasitica TaxID=470096 RepID=A0A6A6W9V6_9PEZI|nr:DUF500-domain-containing protein [Pseudovirgaria hyperparasitica]KAF2758730.1 DUF500-domain-containing protein [Pseudovirgaria hyperparasitica]
MPTQTFWQRTKVGSKVGFDKVYTWVDKLGAPVNRLSNKLGSEAFWPTTLDKESDKAARILRSFCKDGFYQEEEIQPTDGPKQKQKVLKRIPPEVIKNAKGLAIFTTMRTGLWVSGAGGSGIVVARQEDGSWSPPSGIMLHTAGLGFLVGVDIYDCVVVINTQKALDAFSKIRCTLGGEVSAVAGPLGVGGVLETELHKRQAPIFTYLKSRGFYAGVQVDGTVVIERTDENERFYNERISVGDILAGKVRHPPFETRRLLETIRASQGDTNVDSSLLPSEPAPGDYEIEADGHVFGVPDKEDPDPFGVRALEQAGLEIREAGTRNRVSSQNFSFAPSPKSPIFGTFNRQSVDTLSQWSHSRRASQVSNYDRVVSMSDMSTQTDMDGPLFTRPGSGDLSNGIRDSIQSRITESPEPNDDEPQQISQGSVSPVNGHARSNDDGNDSITNNDEKEVRAEESLDSDSKHIRPQPEVRGSQQHEREVQTDSSDHEQVQVDHQTVLQPTRPESRNLETPYSGEEKGHDVEPNHRNEPLTNGHRHSVAISDSEGKDSEDEDLSDDLDDDYDEADVEIFENPVVYQQVQTPPMAQAVFRPTIVTVNKAAPPKLPPRNPIRVRKSQALGNEGVISDTVIDTPISNDASPPEERNEEPSYPKDTEEARQSVLSAGSITNSIAQLRAFDDDEDTIADDEEDEFHSTANSRKSSPAREKAEHL